MTDDIPEIEERPKFYVGAREFNSHAEAEEHVQRLDYRRRAEAFYAANPEHARTGKRAAAADRANIVAFLLWEWRERRGKPSYVEHADERLPVAHIAGAE